MVLFGLHEGVMIESCTISTQCYLTIVYCFPGMPVQHLHWSYFVVKSNLAESLMETAWIWIRMFICCPHWLTTVFVIFVLGAIRLLELNGYMILLF